jgi:hypothetical protein
MIFDIFRWITPVFSTNFLQRVDLPDLGKPSTIILGLMLTSKGIDSIDLVYLDGSFKNFCCSSGFDKKYSLSLYRTAYFLVLIGLEINKGLFYPNLECL